MSILAPELNLKRPKLLHELMPAAETIAFLHTQGAFAGRSCVRTEVSRSYLSQLGKVAFYASPKIVGKLAEVLEVEPAELGVGFVCGST